MTIWGGLAFVPTTPEPVRERVEGVACKAMIHAFNSRPALQGSTGRGTQSVC